MKGSIRQKYRELVSSHHRFTSEGRNATHTLDLFFHRSDVPQWIYSARVVFPSHLSAVPSFIQEELTRFFKLATKTKWDITSPAHNLEGAGMRMS